MGHRTSHPAGNGLKGLLKRAFVNIVPFPYRFGSGFRQTLHSFEKAESLSGSELSNYQDRALVALLDHAYQHIPFYRKKLDNSGVQPGEVRSVERLSRLPLLSKDDLRVTNEDLLRPGNKDPGDFQRVLSGGTTGAPIIFFHEKKVANSLLNAGRFYLWRKCGYSPTERALDLTWAFDGPLRFNPYANWISVSIAKLQKDYVSLILNELLDFEPRFIIGYPSTITLFAEIVRELGADFRGIRSVILGSEMLYKGQRKIIIETFHCSVLQWYGLSELAGFAFSCGDSGRFHFLPQTGILEIVGNDGKAVERSGEEGEIVLTGFFGAGTPFIRYRTGDWAVKTEGICPECGSSYPSIQALCGRAQDYLYASGHRVPLSAVNSHGAVFRNVWKYQFYQDTVGILELRLVVRPEFNDSDLVAIDRFLRETLGAEFVWAVRMVEAIATTDRGKHKFLIQRLEHSDPPQLTNQ
jgi:phenylacetate-CoA ligase